MTLWPKLHQKIRNIDFEWVERHLGAPLPPLLKDFYISGEALELENVIVDEDELYICVAHWQPQNAEGYANRWPGTEGRLILANDGAGNEYHALPEEKFERVYFFDHETGEMSPIPVDIPTFLAKLREWKDAE